MGEEIGSLEIGKIADIIAVELNDVHTQPVYNPMSHLVYASARNNVTDVWLGGRDAVRDRILLTYDEGFLVETARRWGSAIAKSLH